YAVGIERSDPVSRDSVHEPDVSTDINPRAIGGDCFHGSHRIEVADTGIESAQSATRAVDLCERTPRLAANLRQEPTDIEVATSERKRTNAVGGNKLRVEGVERASRGVEAREKRPCLAGDVVEGATDVDGGGGHCERHDHIVRIRREPRVGSAGRGGELGEIGALLPANGRGDTGGIDGVARHLDAEGHSTTGAKRRIRNPAKVSAGRARDFGEPVTHLPAQVRELTSDVDLRTRNLEREHLTVSTESGRVEVGHGAVDGVDCCEVVPRLASDEIEPAAYIERAAVAGYRERVKDGILKRERRIKVGVDAAVGENVRDLRAGVTADKDERASDVEASVAIGHTGPHFTALRFCKRRDPLRRDGVEAREGSGDCRQLIEVSAD